VGHNLWGFPVAHRHRWCTRKNYHVSNKYKNELINYPTPRCERCTANDGNTAAAATNVVRNLSAAAASAARTRAVAAKSHDGSARHSPSPSPSPSLLSPPAVVSCSTAGCHVDASASHPLDSASASKRATLAYPGPIASCLLGPLLPFASRLPAGCRIACCRAPPPRITFCRAAAARVHPRPLPFVRASWLLRRISSHRLRLLTRRRLTTGCVVTVADAQASLPSMRRRLRRRCNCDCHPRRTLSSWRCCPRCHRCQRPLPSLSSSSYPVAPLPSSSASASVASLSSSLSSL
jgi:hypothetical protein